MGTIYTILQFAFVFVGILLVILVMLRKGEMGNLSGAFGGMGGDTAFGVKTQKQLEQIITYLAIFFIVTAIALNTPKFRKNNPASPKGETTKSETTK